MESVEDNQIQQNDAPISPRDGKGDKFRPRVVAIHDWVANSEAELSFRAGDEIIVYAKDPGGWWRGKLENATDDQILSFPENHVKLLQKEFRISTSFLKPEIEDKQSQLLTLSSQLGDSKDISPRVKSNGEILHDTINNQSTELPPENLMNKDMSNGIKQNGNEAKKEDSQDTLEPDSQKGTSEQNGNEKVKEHFLENCQEKAETNGIIENGNDQVPSENLMKNKDMSNETSEQNGNELLKENFLEKDQEKDEPNGIIENGNDDLQEVSHEVDINSLTVDKFDPETLREAENALSALDNLLAMTAEKQTINENLFGTDQLEVLQKEKETEEKLINQKEETVEKEETTKVEIHHNPNQNSSAGQEKEEQTIKEILNNLSESEASPPSDSLPLKRVAPQTRPVWVPDNSSVDCTSCHKLFTLFNRRHHCRSCGGLFCDACCCRRIAIPALHYFQPQRVCKSCLPLYGFSY